MQLPARFLRPRRLCRALMAAAALGIAQCGMTSAQELSFETPGASQELRGTLRAASVLEAVFAEKSGDPQELFAAARAEYGRLLNALYAQGHYGAVISVTLDGREAADIDALEPPSRIGLVRVRIEPGPEFRFRSARMRPYAPGTILPREYRDGEPAYATAVEDAAAAGVKGWRKLGHAKARVADARISADHRADLVDAMILLEAGPVVRFGTLTITGAERMNERRLRKIAGFPTGEVYDPDKLDKVAERLRRTGVFRSVALNEAPSIGPDGTLDVALTVLEDMPRRFGFGGEVASLDGVTVTGFWMHRNLFGGGERLRFDATVVGISSQTGNTNARAAIRLDRPATPDADTSAFVLGEFERNDQEDYIENVARLRFGFERVFSDSLTGRIAFGYAGSRVEDNDGTITDFRQFELPFGLTRDTRDSVIDPTKGTFALAEIMPFLGTQQTGTGARVTADLRGYRGLGAERRVVLAGRFQLGLVAGPDIADTPRNYLFYSGGAGTVRGQPYQSLDVPLPSDPNIRVGGQSFLGLSGEARIDVTESIGIVAFYDAGYIDAGDFFSGNSEFQAGAGLGVRYATPVGPIRFDVAAPVGGSTGDGIQFYLGIGQAF